MSTGMPDPDVLNAMAPVFDRMPMGVAVFDRDLRLVRFNETWAGFIARYTATERDAIRPGVSFFDLAPGTEATMQPIFERVLAGESIRDEAIHLVSTGGADSWWDAVLAPIVAGGVVHGVVDLTADVTDRVLAYRLLEDRVEERTRQLRLLLDLAHDLAATLELRPLADLILDRLSGLVHYRGAALFVLDGGDERMNLLAYRGPIPQERLAWRWSLTTHAHAREVVRTGRPVIIPDVLADEPLARSFRENTVRDIGGLRSDIDTWMGVPLTIGDRVTGMLSVESGQSGPYGPQYAELLQAVAHHAAVAVENARLYEQARGLAVLEERQRLARELHDSVSQALYGIGLGARTARTLLDRDPPRAAEPLDYVTHLAEAGLTEMRALIFELRPDALETEGLVALLEKQASSLRARHGLDVDLDLGPEPAVSLPAKETLYRIAQESLHNVTKHAQATRVAIRLTLNETELVLEISDNGVGFDPGGSFPGHLGLRSMRERAARQGATLDIESAPGRGTRTLVRIPAPQ